MYGGLSRLTGIRCDVVPTVGGIHRLVCVSLASYYSVPGSLYTTINSTFIFSAVPLAY